MSKELVLDIETIPEPKSRIANFKETFGVKNKKASKGGLHFLTGRLVCAGVKPVGCLPAVFADEEEALIFEGLTLYLEEFKPSRIITFNGKAFDLPFLRFRGLLHGYDMTQYLPYERFAKNHFDVYEEVGGKWSMNATLAEYAWFFGVDVIEHSGAEVARQYRKGDWDGIVAHNKGDLEATEIVYKRLTNRNL